MQRCKGTGGNEKEHEEKEHEEKDVEQRMSKSATQPNFQRT